MYTPEDMPQAPSHGQYAARCQMRMASLSHLATPDVTVALGQPVLAATPLRRQGTLRLRDLRRLPQTI